MRFAPNFEPDHELRLPQGTLRYRDLGAGPPIVFVHGGLVNGALWRNVAPPLAHRFRCLVPDLPLGGHDVPMPPDADLSPPSLARLVADFMAALDLRDVTLVGNDTGGALCQLVVADHPERLGRLVLTNCDAFQNFLPPVARPLQHGARLPGFGLLLGWAMRREVVRRALLWSVMRRRPEPGLLDAYFGPLADPGVRRDAVKLMAAVSNRDTLAAAKRFPAFAKPVLIAWAPADKLFFPVRYAHRLAAAFPNARLETIPGSRTFVPEDQPERLVALIDGFATPGERGAYERGRPSAAIA